MRFGLASIGCLAALLAAGAASATPGALHSRTFRTPSKNISCAYYPASVGGHGGVPLRPAERAEAHGRRTKCDVDWTGASMGLRGRAGPTCAGDTVYDQRAPVLGYGSTWTLAGLSCSSKQSRADVQEPRRARVLPVARELARLLVRGRGRLRGLSSGASRARTGDLCHAVAALSQLSYRPAA